MAMNECDSLSNYIDGIFRCLFFFLFNLLLLLLLLLLLFVVFVVHTLIYVLLLLRNLRRLSTSLFHSHGQLLTEEQAF